MMLLSLQEDTKRFNEIPRVLRTHAFACSFHSTRKSSTAASPPLRMTDRGIVRRLTKGSPSGGAPAKRVRGEEKPSPSRQAVPPLPKGEAYFSCSRAGEHSSPLRCWGFMRWMRSASVRQHPVGRGFEEVHERERQRPKSPPHKRRTKTPLECIEKGSAMFALPSEGSNPFCWGVFGGCGGLFPKSPHKNRAPRTIPRP